MGVNIGDNTTVKELAETWLKDYKNKEVRESTYLSYSRTVNVHIVPNLGVMKVRDVKPAHIKRFINGLDDKARGTQRTILRVTRAIFNLAVENEIILRNPCVSSIHPSSSEHKEQIPLTPEQSDMLLNKAKGTTIYLFVLLGTYTGMRRGELLGLQWGDVDFDTGMVQVRRTVAPTKDHPNGELSTTLKTDASKRTIPLPWSVVEDLRAAKAKSRSVFVVHDTKGKHMTFPLLSYYWDKLMDGLPFEAHPHMLRHTRVTRWFEQGLDIKEIQYLAGHATLDMTLGTYTHYQTESRMSGTAEKIRAAM
jgi:integrase